MKDLISYLATIENPQADEYLLRILNTPPRGISDLTAQLAIDWSREHGNSVWAALQDEEFLETLTTRARNSIQEFNELITKYIDISRTGKPTSEMPWNSSLRKRDSATTLPGCARRRRKHRSASFPSET